MLNDKWDLIRGLVFAREGNASVSTRLPSGTLSIEPNKVTFGAVCLRSPCDANVSHAYTQRIMADAAGINIECNMLSNKSELAVMFSKIKDMCPSMISSYEISYEVCEDSPHWERVVGTVYEDIPVTEVICLNRSRDIVLSQNVQSAIFESALLLMAGYSVCK